MLGPKALNPEVLQPVPKPVVHMWDPIRMGGCYNLIQPYLGPCGDPADVVQHGGRLLEVAFLHLHTSTCQARGASAMYRGWLTCQARGASAMWKDISSLTLRAATEHTCTHGQAATEQPCTHGQAATEQPCTRGQAGSGAGAKEQGGQGDGGEGVQGGTLKPDHLQ